jgi:tRNA A-37 threonylcarbamoyl transferase component Bud32
VPPAPAPAPEARVGDVIDGRYRIVEHLATGGMASVYRAEHVHNGTPVAIKVLLKEHSDNAEIAARFQREVQAYRRVQHRHVVAAIDFGALGDGCLFMVLEYMRGLDLCEVLYRDKPFSQARSVKIAFEVAQALVPAHAAGVVHRDLKPENIMLTEVNGETDFVKVVDFGIAKMAARGQQLTALGSVFGTPEYMAPEQARGGTVDHRSDLYTLGIVLYEMLSGTPPFESDAIGQVIMAQLSKPPPPLPPSVDGELAELVMQLLAKDPAERVQSATELVARLGGILARLDPGSPALAAAGGVESALAAAASARTQPSPAVPADAAPPTLTQPAATVSAPVVSVGTPAATPFTPAPVAQAVAPASAPAPSPAKGSSQTLMSAAHSGPPLAAEKPPDVEVVALPPPPQKLPQGCIVAALLVGVLSLLAAAAAVVMVVFR